MDDLPPNDVSTLQLYTLLRLVRDEQERLAERIESLERDTGEVTSMLKSSKMLVAIVKAAVFVAAGIAAVGSALHALGLRA